MSAREKLYAAVMSGGEHSPDRSEKASALIDAYAHELAEEIRNNPLPDSADGRFGPELHAYLEGGNDAADLIDPEVS